MCIIMCLVYIYMYIAAGLAVVMCVLVYSDPGCLV